MTQNDPDAIRAEIDATRRDLSRNIETLNEQVRPGTIARRQGRKVSDSVSGAFNDVKEMVMGSTDQTGNRLSDAGDRVGDATQRAGDAIQGAPAQARRKTQGNPLAAGLIALGAGWLIGSVLPTSRVEREIATDLKDRAQPLVDEVQEGAKAMGENLKPQAQEAVESVESVKGAATEAADTVKAEGQTAAADVKGSARSAGENVRDEAQREKDATQY